jgi:hypothetical protein
LPLKRIGFLYLHHSRCPASVTVPQQRWLGRYCLFSVKVPFENGEPQVVVPEYVPLILEVVTFVAVPLMETVQLGKPVTPPCETEIEKVRVEPDSVPETLPVKTVEPDVDFAVIEPETLVPDCDSVHVI